MLFKENSILSSETSPGRSVQAFPPNSHARYSPPFYLSKVFLGIIPENSSPEEWPSIIHQHRTDYEALRKKHLDLTLDASVIQDPLLSSPVKFPSFSSCPCIFVLPSNGSLPGRKQIRTKQDPRGRDQARCHQNLPRYGILSVSRYANSDDQCPFHLLQRESASILSARNA